jgi:hypothetical protein
MAGQIQTIAGTVHPHIQQEIPLEDKGTCAFFYI